MRDRLAFDGTLLIVVITLLEMSLGVSFPAGHCANREHNLTLALFEVRDQLGRDAQLVLRCALSVSETKLFDLSTASVPELGGRSSKGLCGATLVFLCLGD